MKYSLLHYITYVATNKDQESLRIQVGLDIKKDGCYDRCNFAAYIHTHTP